MMKTLKMLTLSFIAFFTLATVTTAHSSHTVEKGESLYSIGMDYGTSVNTIKNVNGKTSNVLYIGEHLTLPTTLNANQKDLLARLVHAEAKGEPYAGKVAVATVVLNRIMHEEFPNSLEGVIYEVSPTGNYAFSPVQNGAIYEAADGESKRAVNEALAFQGQGNGSIFFYNPETATNHWIATRQQTTVIGNHVFAK